MLSISLLAVIFLRYLH